jgi:crotonobetainyl-CoA:carnitine CoA-transferase CaiB-like acyl-CoA transferase
VLGVGELLDDEQLKARGFVVEVDHPESGPRKTVGLPWKIGGLPEPDYRRAPLMGESNDYVLKELLGLADGEIDDLKSKDVLE